MKVWIIYYIYFWIINSLMAIGTSFIIGILGAQMASILFKYESFGGLVISLVFFLSILCSLIVYQYFILSFFWGKRRGEFEYSFLEKLAENKNSVPGLGKRLKKVRKEFKASDYAEAHSILRNMAKQNPDDFVVQFKYAIACERIGQAQDAISAYETALTIIPYSSKSLTEYVDKQINRVKTKGPSKGATNPGLKFALY